MKHQLLTILIFINFFGTVYGQSTERPSLKETIEWIEQKMDDHVDKEYAKKDNRYEGGFCDDYEAFVDKWQTNIIKMCKIGNDIYTYEIPISKISRFSYKGYGDYVEIGCATKEVKFTTIKIDDNGKKQEYIDYLYSLDFQIDLSHEDNLKERFQKAFENLIYYNNQNKKKEAF